MSSLKSFTPALAHWSFGITILIGLISAEFTMAETVLGIFLAACTTTLSAICSCTSSINDKPYKKLNWGNLIYFLVIWLDILMNLVAVATCARLASATIDYISKGHFRELLLGLEQHSLGEPWPDVLGVTIIIVVTILFMLGLEKSWVISILLFLALLGHFAFFTVIGSFHTINKSNNRTESFQIRSTQMILNSAAICTFGFVHHLPLTSKNQCLKIFTLIFNPILFYTVIAVVFSLMTRCRELYGTAIPLIQVFENRDVDWARPVMAIFTICVVCLLLPEILPSIYQPFVRLASKEWCVFVSSIGYQSRVTGAPVLAIFAAGSLTAILAFACPLSHLIKLLNLTCLIKCILNSCQIVYARYKPELMYNDIQVQTSIHYSKLNQTAAGKTSTKPNHRPSIKQRVKGLLNKKPKYIHKLSTAKPTLFKIGKIHCGGKAIKPDDRQSLLLDEYKEKRINLNTYIDEDNSNLTSENEENEMETLSASDEEIDNNNTMKVRDGEGENSDSSTDIDVIVEEYRAGLRVSSLGKFNERKPSTKTTSLILIGCLILIIVASILIALYIYHIISSCWLNFLAIIGSMLVIMGLPENTAEKSKPCLLPAWIFPLCHVTSITMNTILLCMILDNVWQGVIFWTIAGLLLYSRCECCQCEIIEPLVTETRMTVEPPEICYGDNGIGQRAIPVACGEIIVPR